MASYKRNNWIISVPRGSYAQDASCPPERPQRTKALRGHCFVNWPAPYVSRSNYSGSCDPRLPEVG